VLVVQDQERILSFVEKGLKAQVFVVDTTRDGDGDEGYSLATTEPYDALVLTQWFISA
jgi:DNA-binding response OmpR family regulator